MLRSQRTSLRYAIRQCLLLILLMGTLAWSQLDPPAPIGAVTTQSAPTCTGGLPGGTCTFVRVAGGTEASACPEIPAQPSLTTGGTATIKLNCAKTGGCNGAAGTVVFVAGGAGDTFYDTGLRYGLNVADAVNQNYNLVQIAFNSKPTPNGLGPAGWQSGPSVDGPRALACLYTSIVSWVSTRPFAAQKPLCATGHSSGSSVIAYAMSLFGFGCDSNDSHCDTTRPTFSLVAPTSGPPHANLWLGCSTPSGVDCGSDPMHCGEVDACSTVGNPHLVQESYSGDAATLIDPSYYSNSCAGNGQSCCSQCVSSGGAQQCDQTLWVHDSVLENDSGHPSPFSYFPKTDIEALYGCLDTSAAASLGNLWVSAVTGWNGSAVSASKCVPDSGHRIPDILDGSQQIAASIIGNGSGNGCVAH